MKFTPFLILALLFSPLAAQARMIDKTAAQINSDILLESDVASFRKTFSLRRELDPFTSLTGFSSESTKDILDYLIQERLVLQKFAATDAEVEEEITAVQRNNKIDRDRLKEVLTSQGVKFDDYQKLMATSISKRKLMERELRPLAAVTDEEVKNFYYTENAFRNRQKEQRLVLTYSLQQLLLPKQDLAEQASKRLNAGEDFDSVAADLSSKGAETSRLGAISEENMNEKIRSAVLGLKVGESTKPMSAGSGYMILKITEIGAPKDPIFEKEKEKIRGTLFQKALLTQLKLWTERERVASYIHIP